MTEHKTLVEAMNAGDELGEAEIRYQLLAAAFEENPQMRSQLNPSIERAKAEILRLRALLKKPETVEADAGKVIPFDANRFSKSS